MLGYDARALKYGANGFMHQIMAETESKPTRTFTEKLIYKMTLIKGQQIAPVNPSGEIPVEKVKVAGGC
jgi:hypothetical protein